MDRAEAVREMTFEEEAVLYQQEAKAIFEKEDVGYEAPPINSTVRRGMRIIRKAQEEIAALREQEQREQGCDVCREGKTLTAIFTDKAGRDRLMAFAFCPVCGRKMPEVSRE